MARLGGIGVALLSAVTLAGLGASGEIARASARPAAPPLRCGQQRILIVHTYWAPLRLQSKLLATRGVAAVDLFEAGWGTPTLQELAQYTTVVVSSEEDGSNQAALGDVLADYLDRNGIVVATNFVWDTRGHWDLRGRWLTGGYSPYETTVQYAFSNSTLGLHDPDHPLMSGVTTLSDPWRSRLTLATGSTQVAAWADSLPLIAFKGHAVGINADLSSGGDWDGQFPRVIVNAGDWLCSASPTPRSKRFAGRISRALRHR